MREYLTIPQAARQLEIAEGRVRYAIGVGLIRVAKQKGPYGAKLLARQDVDAFARQNEVGHYGRAARTISFIGIDKNSDQACALRAAQCIVEVSDTLLEGLSVGGNTLPILVIGDMNEQDTNLLRTLIGDCYCIVVTDDPDQVDPHIAQCAVLCDPTELRRLVQHATAFIEKRRKQAKFKI